MQLRDDIPNFSWEEVVAGFKPDERFWEHMRLLQKMRDWWDAPFRVSSGFRSSAHNNAVGGANKSQHMIFATDIIPSTKSPLLEEPYLPIALEMLADKADELGFNGIGLYDNFIHLDKRETKSRWDNSRTN